MDCYCRGGVGSTQGLGMLGSRVWGFGALGSGFLGFNLWAAWSQLVLQTLSRERWADV